MQKAFSGWQILTIFDRAMTHLEPLAIAANISQAAHTRLDHCLLAFGNLFRIFLNPEVLENVRVGLLASFEKHWAKTPNQEVYIITVFLNPYIHSCCFNSTAITHADLYSMASQIFERVFETHADVNFLEAFMDYYAGEKEFSPSRMNLELVKQLYNEKVYLLNYTLSVHANNHWVFRRKKLISSPFGGVSTQSPTHLVMASNGLPSIFYPLLPTLLAVNVLSASLASPILSLGISFLQKRFTRSMLSRWIGVVFILKWASYLLASNGSSILTSTTHPRAPLLQLTQWATII